MDSPHPFDEPLQRFLVIAEKTFQEPTDIVKAGWKLNEGSYVFARPAYQFSEYEKFVFQFTMLLAGIGSIDRATAEQLIASATYADGKAAFSGVTYPGHDHAVMHGLISDRSEHFVPKNLSAYANLISEKIREHQQADSPPVLRAWLARHVTPPKPTGLDSALFSEEPGPYALPLGQNPANGKTVHYVGEASLLTIAPSGKGKTQCHVLPALASYRGPAIVLDIKGECHEHTAAWRSANIGPVIRFNPVEPEHSASYNPLAFVDDHPDELWESARFLAELLVVTRSQHDPTWESQGKDLLTLIIAYVVVNEADARKMSQVLDLVATIGLADMFATVSHVDCPLPSAMKRVAARFGQMAKAAPRQFEGVLSGASQHLQVWEGPKLERVTGHSDWHPEDLATAPCPTLYLCIPPNAIETYAPVLRVIIGQHVRRLMRRDSKPAAPILFMLDELPRLGRMEPVREALEVGRSYGIKLWMFAQYAEQIVHAYPGVGDGMMENCDVRMYMNPPSAIADRIARAFGKADSVLESTKRPVIETADIMGPAHRDSIFTLGANETPLVLHKQFFHRAQSVEPSDASRVRP
ncbi:MAG: type IV secretory system conjugative DNA transfer family protein [Afipia sp.]|nr:type IV secretory system conjugative DNA transfer family protein [Afipia sp.]